MELGEWKMDIEFLEIGDGVLVKKCEKKISFSFLNPTFNFLINRF